MSSKHTVFQNASVSNPSTPSLPLMKTLRLYLARKRRKIERHFQPVAVETKETISSRAHNQYVHTLVSAYRQYGIPDDITKNTVAALGHLISLNEPARLEVMADAARSRLSLISLALGQQILSTPQIRILDFGDITIKVPIINQQGIDWYLDAPLDNFDFLVERSTGLLDGARTVYDFGGHHGVWSAYYARVVSNSGTVYSFEPSILNVEVAAMLHLLNDISNVVIIAAAVGTHTDHDGTSDTPGILVDFVVDMRVIDIRSAVWSRGDFMKMDIEGFEYDLLTKFPWLFDLARNIHLELHIPHLEKRGLDYSEIMKHIPFDQFEIKNTNGWPIGKISRETQLSGFCSLMMRRISA